LSISREDICEKVLAVQNTTFDEVAHTLYQYQLAHIPSFKEYRDNLLRLNPNLIEPVFLPIQAFKNHKLFDPSRDPSLYFESSGTTATLNAKHYILDEAWYLQNATTIFAEHIGHPKEFCFLALLPHYLERKHSSLVAMVRHFISISKYNISGFFLKNHEQLYQQLRSNKEQGIPTILFGVSFGLLDFAQEYTLNYADLIVMDTGGMKGRKEEITRDQLVAILKQSFGTESIFSEYGMTELLSQAYTSHDEWFKPGKTMRVHAREINDPLSDAIFNRTGVLHIIDLANIDSCAFIATEDLGLVNRESNFKVLGRLDYSDLRGCNLMVGDT
jgi:hypothetical protein